MKHQPVTPSSQRRRPWTTAVLGAVGVLLLASCGTPADEAASSESTPADTPQRIVSLSPTATETLFEIGAGDQVVAVDDQSDYPEEAPASKLSAFKPNVEAVLGYEPDLVITSNPDKALVSGLKSAGVETLVQVGATTIDDAYTQIEQIGAATGRVGDAAELIAQMQEDIERVVAEAPDAKGLTYYHELDPTLYTTTSKTFIGEVYGLFGLRNIADEAKSGDYPQLSDEYVVDADPDLIMLADSECCGITPAKVEARPGWSDIAAVRNGLVEPLNEDLASRWGPRLVEFVEDVGEVVTRAHHSAATAQ